MGQGLKGLDLYQRIPSLRGVEKVDKVLQLAKRGGMAEIDTSRTVSFLRCCGTNELQSFGCYWAPMEVKKTYEFNPDTDLLGQGGFGKVYKARDVNLEMDVALKRYNTGELPDKYSLFEEIKKSIRLSHTNLVRYYDAFEVESGTTFGDKIQIGVMEYINGGNLHDYLSSNPSLNEIREVFLGIMDGLDYLHNRPQKIIHRDLKPENILMQKEGSEVIPKICDFGISKVLGADDKNSSTMIIGSVEYMAPEQFNGKRYGINGGLSTNLDIWSLGVMIYEAFEKAPPFGKTTMGFARDEVMRNILEKEDLNFSNLPPDFAHVCRLCLVKDANQRESDMKVLMEILRQQLPAPAVSQSANTQMFGNSNVGQTAVVGGATTVGALAAQRRRESQSNTGTGYSAPVNSGSDYRPPEPVLPQAPIAEREPAKFGLSYWIPLITAAIGFGFFHNKTTLLGANPHSEDNLFYQFLLFAGLSVINIFSVILLNTKRYEYFNYALSFTILTFYLVRCYLYYDAGGASSALDTRVLTMSWYFVLGAMGITAISLLARIRSLRWFEVIPIFLTASFLLSLLLHWRLSQKSMILAEGGMAAVLLVVAIWASKR